MPIILIIISILLDGLLTNYLPYLPNDLSLFTPSLTLITVFLIYPFYRKNKNKYFITIFITGIIYDLFYTNLLFMNGIIYLIIGIISIYIHKNFELGIIKTIIFTIIIISIYELLLGLILYIFRIVPVNINKIYYKIIHTLILNIIYAEIIIIINKLIPRKYRKISIN